FTSTPTNTFTSTPTITPSPTATVCGNYNTSTTGGAIVAGTTDIGNHTDDGTTNIVLPFTMQFYNNLSASSVNVSSNGDLQLTGINTAYTNDCLPSATLVGPTIYAHWDDLMTNAGLTGCTA